MMEHNENDENIIRRLGGNLLSRSAMSLGKFISDDDDTDDDDFMNVASSPSSAATPTRLRASHSMSSIQYEEEFDDDSEDTSPYRAPTMLHYGRVASINSASTRYSSAPPLRETTVYANPHLQQQQQQQQQPPQQQLLRSTTFCASRLLGRSNPDLSSNNHSDQANRIEELRQMRRSQIEGHEELRCDVPIASRSHYLVAKRTKSHVALAQVC
jgi:hypothetical protein